MSPRLGRIIGVGTILVWLAVFCVGAALLSKASKMDAHFDEQKAQALTERYEADHFGMSPTEREQRASEIVNLRTKKWLLYNVGVCICLIAVTLAIPIVRFRLWDIGNLKTVTTPPTRWRLIALAGAAWLALIPEFLLDLQDAYAQDDLLPLEGYGPGGDSGLFLLTQAPIIILIWIVAVFACRFLVLRRVSLPVMLWHADYDRSYRSLGVAYFYGGVILLLVFLVGWSAVYFKWALPSELIGIYVLLSSRAALLSDNRDV